MERIDAAILGATGVVGQQFLKMLTGHPFFRVTAVCASDARLGQQLGDIQPLVPGGIPEDLKDLAFSPLNVASLQDAGVRVVFSALPTDAARRMEFECADAGLKVFSNASVYRMAAEVPILIPEINAAHLQLVWAQTHGRGGFIVTNANCTTTGLALALMPLRTRGIRKVIIASYQAISGAGYPGVAALDIMANVIPFIDGEESKVRSECRKIFGRVEGSALTPADWEIHAHCIRVATITGHLVSLHAELDQPITQGELEALYQSVPSPPEVRDLPTAPAFPVLLVRDPMRPQPKLDLEAGYPERARGMAVTVGRLEAGGSVVRMVALSHNLIRGAAGGSILNAELAVKMGMLKEES